MTYENLDNARVIVKSVVRRIFPSGGVVRWEKHPDTYLLKLYTRDYEITIQFSHSDVDDMLKNPEAMDRFLLKLHAALTSRRWQDLDRSWNRFKITWRRVRPKPDESSRQPVSPTSTRYE